jgi:acyl-CoA:acyl-CoA alkyltransferase
MKRAKIASVSVYHPTRVVLNSTVENLVNTHGKMLPEGSLLRLFGIQERRFAAPEEQVSDLAAKAARPIVLEHGANKIDCLIFAAACADLIEPATSNIVQYKLGLKCPVLDIKNACNSFTTAMMTASSYIASGMYRNVLIVNGEKLSDAIRFHPENEGQLRRGLAAYSLGDAGAAVLMTESTDDSGMQYQKFMSNGAHWELCTIRGGGSMHPRDADKNYFEGQTVALKDVLIDAGTRFFHECLAEAGWTIPEVQHLFTHQVSSDSTRLIAQFSGVALDRIEAVFPYFGNTAAASIPLAIYQRMQRGAIQPGDKVAILGLAAGVSVSVQLITW